MENFDEFVKQDLKWMFAIQKYCYHHHQFDNFMRSIVSKYPYQDVVLLLHIFFILGIFEIGHTHFWLCSLNLSVTFAIRKLIAAKRPVEYNRALMPIADLAAESYGFPSLESHMSIVIFGHLMMHLNLLLTVPAAIFVIPLVGFSRCYARSRFVHQVVLSYATGLIGLIIGLQVCGYFDFERMVKHHYVFLLFMCLSGFLCHFMLCVENQESRIFGTPKQEFLRVLTEIINPPAIEDPLVIPDDNDAVRDEEGEDVLDTHRVEIAPGDSDPVLTPAQLRRRKINNAKRDSFFFLQRSLERRAAEAAGVAPSPDDLSPRSRGRNRNSGIEKVA